MAHRTSISNVSISGLRSPLHLRTTITRTRRSDVSQIRSLWWWGRQGNEWSSSSFDEQLEEKIKRHQRIMRHRYSKALRRRDMWERDANPRMSWPFRLPSRWLGGQMSDLHNASTGKESSKFENAEPPKMKPDEPWTSFQKQFDSFKQEVDRAIDRDPYGTLFGRRIQSPPSTSNTSWTSFSWIFEPKEVKQANETVEQDARGKSLTKSTPSKVVPITGQSTSVTSSNSIPRSQSDVEDEYQYDPISMRKIPKAKQEAEVPPPKKGLFDTLFGEHGSDIPVKPCKPHKVYGYGAEPKETKSVKPVGEKPKKGFESSRKRELQSLMACTLGNNIDTTAEFGGKYRTSEELEAEVESPPAKRFRESPEPSDETPLFKGTTYESKADEISKRPRPDSEWLRKEGFKSADDVVVSSKSSEAVEIPVKRFKSKIEPSLDRVNTKPDIDKTAKATPLQPALDRSSERPVRKINVSKEAERLKTPEETTKDKVEDIDLLRASDIRAATKSARISKQELESSKKQTRDHLEADYSSRQKSLNENLDSEANTSTTTTDKLSKSLSNVWSHIKEYPNGIVAKTMRSMGFNENFKKYEKPYKPVEHSTKKLDFDDAALEKVASIYKSPLRRPTKPLTSFTPSTDALNAEIQIKERTANLQRINNEAKLANQREDAKVVALGEMLRKEYESEYGTIDTNHRQSKVVVEDPVKPISSKTEKPHPLKSATVKEGVARYPAIEDHVSKFEPAYAAIVDGAKEVRRELHDIGQHYRQLRSRQPRSSWRMLEETEEDMNQVFGAAINQSTNASTPTSIPETKEADQKVSDTVKESKKTVEEPVFTPAGSKVWNDEQPPTAEQLQIPSLISTYIILAYNENTKKAEMSPMNMPAIDINKPVNTLKILAQLSHAPEFLRYFPQLETANYELVNGGSDTLIFKKRSVTSDFIETKRTSLRNKIAVEETAAQPDNQVSQGESKNAATVLDEIPVDIGEGDGPKTDIKPPSSPKPKSKPQPIRRQENVFSGTLRSPPDRVTASESESAHNASEKTSSTRAEIPKDGLWKRFRRGARRVILTALAMGGVAYAIGVAAEGIGAQAQLKQGTDSESGPRKRIVMSGQRPGIFSTESSRS